MKWGFLFLFFSFFTHHIHASCKKPLSVAKKIETWRDVTEFAGTIAAFTARKEMTDLLPQAYKISKKQTFRYVYISENEELPSQLACSDAPVTVHAYGMYTLVTLKTPEQGKDFLYDNTIKDNDITLRSISTEEAQKILRALDKNKAKFYYCSSNDSHYLAILGALTLITEGLKMPRSDSDDSKKST